MQCKTMVLAFIINEHIKCFFNFRSNVTKEADVLLNYVLNEFKTLVIHIFCKPRIFIMEDKL